MPIGVLAVSPCSISTISSGMPIISEITQKGRLVSLAVAVTAGHHHDAAGGVDAYRGALIEARAGAQLPDEVRGRDTTGLDIAVHTRPRSLPDFSPSARRAAKPDVRDLEPSIVAT